MCRRLLPYSEAPSQQLSEMRVMRNWNYDDTRRRDHLRLSRQSLMYLIVKIIRAHRMHSMDAADVAYGYRCSVVCMSVCLLVTTVCVTKTVEPIKMPFGVWTRGSMEPCIRWKPKSPYTGMGTYEGRHMAPWDLPGHARRSIYSKWLAGGSMRRCGLPATITVAIYLLFITPEGSRIKTQYINTANTTRNKAINTKKNNYKFSKTKKST